MSAVQGLRAVFRAAWALALAWFGLAAQANGLSLEQAIDLARQGSGKLEAAQAGIQQAEAQARSVEGLGGPIVTVGALGYAFDKRLNVPLDPYASNFNGLVNNLPIPPSSLPIPIQVPSLPSSLPVQVRQEGVRGMLTGVLPLYTGGRIDGVKALAAGRTDESAANARQATEALDSTVAQRYFSLQLARQALLTRQQAHEGIAKHLQAAKRMEAQGFIAKVERLQADVAMSQAEADLLQARHQAALADSALAHTLAQPDQTNTLSTPLFVYEAPLPPLQDCIEQAWAHHPGMAIVSAKRRQAEGLHQISRGGLLPTAFAFSAAETQKGRPDWIVGIGIQFTLVDGLDRRELLRASDAAQRQVEASDKQARSDIALLVEKAWRDTDQTRQRVHSFDAQAAQAHEYLRLRTRGLQEGLSTPLDLVDAELNLAKVRIGRAQAAFEHIIALSTLLEAMGSGEQLGSWARKGQPITP